MERINSGNVGSIIGALPGCVAYYVIDAGGGSLATVSVFEDQAGVDASTAKAGEWVKENILPDFTISGPDTTSGKVIIKA
jgi:hypothetical protein